MKSKTTTREYDDDGKLVKETVIEQDTDVVQWMNVGCTCNWYGHASFAYCPVHGYVKPHGWHCGGVTTTTDRVYTFNTSPAMQALTQALTPVA